MIQVGDRVVCVDAKDCYHLKNGRRPLIEGREYIVYGITEFCNCGLVVDVGVDGEGSSGYCPKCWVYYTNPKAVWWFLISRFRKVEERTIEYTVDVKIEIPEPCLS